MTPDWQIELNPNQDQYPTTARITVAKKQQNTGAALAQVINGEVLDSDLILGRIGHGKITPFSGSLFFCM